MLYKSRGAEKEKMIMFICLCMIFIAFVGINLEGVMGVMKESIYKKTLNKEIPLAVTSIEEEDQGSFLKKLLLSSISMEMNLMSGDVLMSVRDDHNSVIDVAENGNDYNADEFTYDYGIYEDKNIKVSDRYKDDNTTVGVYNPAIVYNYPTYKPQILIYHTHNGESYTKGGQLRDNSKNVYAIGSELQQQLENYGINVIHDKTIHDDKDYDDSYKYSGKTLEKYLDKYGKIDLIIDMHIDAHDNKPLVTAKINGKNAAKVLFVFSDNARKYQNNFDVSKSLIDITKGLYPEILRSSEAGKGEFHYGHGKESFNQTKAKSVVVLEMGANCNTFEEGMETPKYIARVIAEYLYKKYTEV